MKRLLAAQAGQGSPGGSAGYTANAAAELRQRCPIQSPRDWLDPAVQSAALRSHLCHAAASSVMHMPEPISCTSFRKCLDGCVVGD